MHAINLVERKTIKLRNWKDPASEYKITFVSSRTLELMDESYR